MRLSRHFFSLFFLGKAQKEEIETHHGDDDVETTAVWQFYCDNKKLRAKRWPRKLKLTKVQRRRRQFSRWFNSPTNTPKAENSQPTKWLATNSHSFSIAWLWNKGNKKKKNIRQSERAISHWSRSMLAIALLCPALRELGEQPNDTTTTTTAGWQSSIHSMQHCCAHGNRNSAQEKPFPQHVTKEKRRTCFFYRAHTSSTIHPQSIHQLFYVWRWRPWLRSYV